MKTKHYHNTTNESATTVRKKVKKCVSQERQILTVFLKKQTKLTASQVLNSLNSQPLLTSVRRAMSNLKAQNHLQKLDEKKIGLFGSPEHYYQLT